MESKKMIRIGVRLTEAIIEILREELEDDKKVKSINENKQKKIKTGSQRSRKNNNRSFGFSSN